MSVITDLYGPHADKAIAVETDRECRFDMHGIFYGCLRLVYLPSFR